MQVVTPEAAQTDIRALMKSALKHAPVVIENEEEGDCVVSSREDFEKYQAEYRKARGRAANKLFDKMARDAKKRGLTDEIAQTLLEP